jgi:putative oxidoreductase
VNFARRIFAKPAYEPDDWFIRIAVAILYLAFGLDKFVATREWVPFFRQVGIGDWFRVATGAIEMGGALLVAIPRTALAGLLLLACVTASAALIWAVALSRPGDGVVPGGLRVALAVIAWMRWRECVHQGALHVVQSMITLGSCGAGLPPTPASRCGICPPA